MDVHDHESVMRLPLRTGTLDVLESPTLVSVWRLCVRGNHIETVPVFMISLSLSLIVSSRELQKFMLQGLTCRLGSVKLV